MPHMFQNRFKLATSKSIRVIDYRLVTPLMTKIFVVDYCRQYNQVKKIKTIHQFCFLGRQFFFLDMNNTIIFPLSAFLNRMLHSVLEVIKVITNLFNNCRPVSFLPIMSKIIVRHAHNCFYEYLRRCNIINKKQSGFKPKHSCETALHSFIEKWLRNIDNGNITVVLFVDLSKAFDTVNHHVLLHKLLSFGICNNTHNWFKSYLTNRSQCVRWNGTQSDKLGISVGLP